MKLLLVLVSALFVCALPAAAAPGRVVLLRTPQGGIQPQAVVDTAGTLHILYFMGDPAGGDLYYVHRKIDRDGPFSDPIRVNSQPRTAIAIGTIRGAQIAVGGNHVYVAWNGVGPKSSSGYPKLYAAFTRLGNSGTAFEPQRSLSLPDDILDGGGSLAADAEGRVYVTWHMSPIGQDEAAGGVFLVRSTDYGQTFNHEKKAGSPLTGQCGCCSMRAFVARSGVLYILYRTARGNVRRDSTLLMSQDRGETFQTQTLQAWPVNACPMSSFSLAEGETGVVGAWETQEQVYYARLSPAAATPLQPIAAPGQGRRKYPLVVPNSNGQTLFAWVEGAGWQRGGALAWQCYDKTGNTLGEVGHAAGVPVWSLISAVPCPDGSFILIY